MNVTVNLDFLPKGGVEMDWQAGEMQIRYEMDKLNFDWKASNVSICTRMGRLLIFSPPFSRLISIALCSAVCRPRLSAG